MKLGQAFDPRNNSLNTWRLLLASGVFLFHSFELTGRRISFKPADQLLGHVWVDGFFAISGFLVASSWLRNPHVSTYLVARGLRIFPRLWVCLIVTAFVIAPVGVAIQGGASPLRTTAPLEYVLKNCTTVILDPDVGGTPQNVPYSGMWNGSLWTLQFEVLCYIAIMVLGLVGLLKRRWFLAVALAAMLGWSAILPPWTADEPVSLAQIFARFAVMFLAGALIHQCRDVIVARWSVVAVCAAIVLGSCFLPNYRLLAALPLAYMLIVMGALVRGRHSQLRNDLSYGVYIYAWPVQQLLVICGLGFLNPIVFATVVAFPVFALAAVSWFWVEKPALSLKDRLPGRSLSQRPRPTPTGNPKSGGT